MLRIPPMLTFVIPCGLILTAHCGAFPSLPTHAPKDAQKATTNRPEKTEAIFADAPPKPFGEHQNAKKTATFEASLLALIAEMAAVDGLVPALYQAAEQADIPALATSLHQQLTYADVIEVAGSDINSPPQCQLQHKVDRSLPAVGNNRSVLQRILALVEESHQLPMCNATFKLGTRTYEKCELFEISDLADFYVHVLAQKAVLTLHFDGDALLSKNLTQPDDTWLPLSGSPMTWISGVHGFTPTDAVDPACVENNENCLSFDVDAHAAHRLVFSTFDGAYDGSLLPSGAERTRWVLARAQVEGEPFDERHGKVLFAWECGDFAHHLQPFMEAFVSRGRADLVIRMLRLMHAHWMVAATQGDLNHVDVPSAGLVRAEEFLGNILKGGLRDALDAAMGHP